jgi:hypothetical protein
MLITTTGECLVQPLRRFSLAELRGMFLTVNLYNGPPAVVERMLLIAPDEPDLWHEAGILQGKIGNLRTSIAALERLAALSRGGEQQAMARQLLSETKSRLN